MFFHPLHEEKKKTSICGGEIGESDWKSLEEEKRWKDNGVLGKIEMLSDNVSFKIQRIYYFLFISWISWLIEIIIEIKIKNAR